MSTAPDIITDDGIAVWTDITDEHRPCEAADVPVPRARPGYAQIECAGAAERRYDEYEVCNAHFDTGRAWAAADAADRRAENAAARHFEEIR